MAMPTDYQLGYEQGLLHTHVQDFLFAGMADEFNAEFVAGYMAGKADRKLS